METTTIIVLHDLNMSGPTTVLFGVWLGILTGCVMIITAAYMIKR